MNKIVFLFLMVCTGYISTAQENVEVYAGSQLGLEVQVYPTGIIPGLRYEFPLSAKSNMHLRAGYQLIDHRDLGVQDDETGSGYGFSIGYKHFFNKKWSLMLKNDLWFNTIDWIDNEGTDQGVGTTDITVLQPTLQLEYGVALGENLILAPSVAFGLEWNVKTEGRPTGEGPILLLGLALSHKL